jgi:hypothetical protein
MPGGVNVPAPIRWWKCIRWLSLACFIAVAAVQAADPPPPGKDDWKYDVVYRKKASPFFVLILEEKPAQIKILSIVRKPGKPTVLREETVYRPEIDRVDRLSDTDRDELEQRVKALRRDRELLVAQLKLLDPAAKGNRTIDMVNLQPADWPADTKVKALQYQSTHFNLISNAKEEVVQLAAIQLEQVYAAYARALPPRDGNIRPTTILLTRSIDDYKTLVREQRANLVNPAFYDDAKNQIVCGSDLERLSNELERLHERHAALYGELNDREKELKQVYKGAIPNEIAGPIEEARRKIQAAEVQNKTAFGQAQKRLFQPLYHEAFHAYIATAVYPRGEGEVPLWLNEGLAQIFETAIFEAGELRVGHADKGRLEAVQQALKKKELLGLADLLRSGAKQFQVAHASDKQASDQHYLASWAVAYYLTFDRKLLGTKALDDYVRALQRGTEPLDAFQDLVGTPLPQFEKDFQQYLTQLQSDGSVLKK